MPKYFVVIYLISLCSCNFHSERSTINENFQDSSCYHAKREIEEYFAANDTSVYYLGDIDEDNLEDTAYGVSHIKMKDDSCKWLHKQYLEIYFSNSKNKIFQENAFGGILVNLGKLTTIDQTSLIYFPSWNTSNHRTTFIYSNINEKWVKTATTGLNESFILEGKNPEKKLKSMVIAHDLSNKNKTNSFILKEFDWNAWLEKGIEKYKNKTIKMNK
jgi:hypothetical protein